MVIEWAPNAETGAVTDVGINHRGGNIFVPEEFLNGPDIITILQQMRSKTVPESMTACRFGDPGGPNSLLDGILQVSFCDVVPAFFPPRGSTEIFSAGKTYCQDQSRAAFEYFRCKALGR